MTCFASSAVHNLPRLLGGLVLIAGLFFCSSLGVGSHAAEPASAAAPAALAAKTSDTLLKVNGEPVSRAEYEGRLAELMATAPPNLDQRKLQQGRAQAAERVREDLIMERLIEQAICREGVEPSPRRVDEELVRVEEMMKAGGSSMEQYRQEFGLSVEQVREDVRRKLAADALFDKLLGFAPPTEEETRQFYDKHKSKYAEPEQRRVSQITLVFEGKAEPTKAQREALRAKAEALRQRLLKGEDFAKLARENSQGPMAGEGGDLGWIVRATRMPSELIDAAFTQAKGAVGEVVESPIGYHIVLVTDTRPSRQIPYEEVAPLVRADLTQERRAKKVPGLLKKMRKEAKVEEIGGKH